MKKNEFILEKLKKHAEEHNLDLTLLSSESNASSAASKEAMPKEMIIEIPPDNPKTPEIKND